MKILSGTFFQRTLSSKEFAMIGFVSLDHPVSDTELYLMFNHTIEHLSNYSISDDSIIQGIEGLLTQNLWPICQIGQPVRFICVDEQTLSYIIYSASPYAFVKGLYEQFYTLENNQITLIDSLTKTNGCTLSQIFYEPIWSNSDFKDVSVNPLDTISFNFYNRGYPILKRLLNQEIDFNEAHNLLNMSQLEEVYFKKFLKPDNSYKDYLKFKFNNIESETILSRITLKENYILRQTHVSNLIKSLIKTN